MVKGEMTEELPDSAVDKGRYWLVSTSDVYRNLICEFTHYDVCLTGLIRWGFGKAYVRVVPDHQEEDRGYIAIPVVLDRIESRYLEVYRLTYHHWWYTEGKRPIYDGRRLFPLRAEFPDGNPLLFRIQDTLDYAIKQTQENIGVE